MGEDGAAAEQVQLLVTKKPTGDTYKAATAAADAIFAADGDAADPATVDAREASELVSDNHLSHCCGRPCVQVPLQAAVVAAASLHTLTTLATSATGS